jgi:hypothetical protein
MLSFKSEIVGAEHFCYQTKTSMTTLFSVCMDKLVAENENALPYI